MPKQKQRADMCVIGQGYIGLPTAALFAAHGMRVVGYDINARAVRTINKGQIHIEEPDLAGMVKQVVNDGLLKASTKPAQADYFLITVPTPVNHRTHKPDMSHVDNAVRTIAPLLKKGDTVILESTSPVGSTDNMAQQLAKLRPDLAVGEDILVAYCPERVLPGRILHELIHNDRIIGGITPKSTDSAVALYKKLVKGQLLATDAPTAEMVKLTENAYRDVNIAFANELSIVCEKLKLNVWDVIGLANHHPRVNILQPGPGVGGHCIAVDPWFIIDAAPKQTPLMTAARHVNDGKPAMVVKQVAKAAKQYSAKPTILCLGLSFKPNVDDLRESPAITVVEMLAKKKIGNIIVIEPHIHALPAQLKPYRMGFARSVTKELMAKADIIVPLVKHVSFEALQPHRFGADADIIDACGLFNELR